MNIIKRAIKTHSKTTVFFDRDGKVIDIISNAGRTRNNRAAYYLHCNMTNPPLRQKLRRRWEYRFDNIIGRIVGSENAADEPFIGFEKEGTV